MSLSALSASVEQVCPILQLMQEPLQLPGHTFNALYERLSARREDDADIDMICRLIERFAELEDPPLIEMVGIFEKHLFHPEELG